MLGVFRGFNSTESLALRCLVKEMLHVISVMALHPSGPSRVAGHDVPPGMIYHASMPSFAKLCQANVRFGDRWWPTGPPSWRY